MPVQWWWSRASIVCRVARKWPENSQHVRVLIPTIEDEIRDKARCFWTHEDEMKLVVTSIWTVLVRTTVPQTAKGETSKKILD